MRRSYARHHPVPLVMLGTLFLIWQKTHGHQQWPMLSFNDLVTTAQTRLLPRRLLAAEELAPILEKRQRRQAKKSRRRRSAVVLE